MMCLVKNVVPGIRISNENRLSGSGHADQLFYVDCVHELDDKPSIPIAYILILIEKPILHASKLKILIYNKCLEREQSS